jgi:hypothetical protein
LEIKLKRKKKCENKERRSIKLTYNIYRNVFS